MLQYLLDCRSRGCTTANTSSSSSANGYGTTASTSTTTATSSLQCSQSFQNTYHRMKRRRLPYNNNHYHDDHNKQQQQQQQLHHQYQDYNNIDNNDENNNFVVDSYSTNNETKYKLKIQQRYTPDFTHQIIIPSSTGTSSTRSSTNVSRPKHRTLDIDQQQYRFLLSGESETGTISIFDLSKWGGTKTIITTTTTTKQNNKTQLNKRSTTSRLIQQGLRQSTTTTSYPSYRYEPIQQALVPTISSTLTSTSTSTSTTATTNNTSSTSTLPGTLLSTNWYPTDTGAFVTATQSASTTIDCIHLWDTSTMKPVVGFHPYRYETTTTSPSVIPILSCFTFPTSSSSTSTNNSSSCIGAVTSKQSNHIKLIDFRTVSASQSFQSNVISSTTGYTYVTFSQQCPFLMATGTTTIRGTTNNNNKSSMIVLWDIRKSGSLSCLTVLDQYYQQHNNTNSSSSSSTDSSTSERYVPDGSHWNQLKRIELYQQQKEQEKVINMYYKNQRKLLSQEQQQQQQYQTQRKRIMTNNKSSINTRLQNLHNDNNNNKKRKVTVQSVSKSSEGDSNNTDKRMILLNQISPNNYNSVLTGTNTLSSTSHSGCVNGIKQLQFHPSSGHYLISTANTIVGYNNDDDDDYNNNYDGTNTQKEMIKVWDLRTAGHWIKSCRFRIPTSSTTNDDKTKLGPMVLVDHYSNGFDHHHYYNSTSHRRRRSSIPLPYTDRTMIWLGYGNNVYGYPMEPLSTSNNGTTTTTTTSSSNGNPVAVLQGHLGPIHSIVYDPSYDRFITAAEDGLILTWPQYQHEIHRNQYYDDDNDDV